MRILFVTEVDWMKKVVFEIHYLSELLSKRGHQVYAVDCRDPGDLKRWRTHRLEISRTSYGSPVTLYRPCAINLPILNRLSAFVTHYFVIDKIIKENSVEAIILYSAPTNGYHTVNLAKKYKIPVLFRSFDILHGLAGPILGPPTKMFEKYVYRNADGILAVTSFVSHYVRELGASENKIIGMPGGVSLEIFKPLPRDENLAAKLNIDPLAKIVVFVSTLFEFSGIEGLMRQVYSSEKTSFREVFVIVGGGPMLERYKKLAKELGINDHFIFVGKVPATEVPAYINLADICINSFDVTFITERLAPIKIFEYLACGKPVVSTPLKGAIELLHGESGVVFCKSEELLQTIRNLLYDETARKRLGAQGLDTIRKKFGWEKVADIVEDELKQLAGYR
jgi:glycosyltransferase involved in cell wall biosynthesis